MPRAMTYYVEYVYSYNIGEEEIEEIDSGRFHCCKKDIKKMVELKIKDDLKYESYSDLNINIYDFYLTIDCI